MSLKLKPYTTKKCSFCRDARYDYKLGPHEVDMHIAVISGDLVAHKLLSSTEKGTDTPLRVLLFQSQFLGGRSLIALAFLPSQTQGCACGAVAVASLPLVTVSFLRGGLQELRS